MRPNEPPGRAHGLEGSGDDSLTLFNTTSLLSFDEVAAMIDGLTEAHGGSAMPEGIRTSGAGTRRSHYTPHS
jgi:hypothetical protein